MNIQHSARSDNWWTPPAVLDLAREVLGQIDLDPASCLQANAAVGATRYYTEADDGLTLPWAGTVWCNPPGGRRGNKSLAGLFWLKLIQDRGALTHAIFMAFSAEALQNTQRKGGPSIMDFPFCVPAKRIRFLKPGVEATSPSHSNVVVYVPGTIDKTAEFVRVFSALGACKR